MLRAQKTTIIIAEKRSFENLKKKSNMPMRRLNS